MMLCSQVSPIARNTYSRDPILNKESKADPNFHGFLIIAWWIFPDLHSLMVLPILVLLIGELLDPTLTLPQVLLGILHSPILSIKLRFKLTNSNQIQIIKTIHI